MPAALPLPQTLAFFSLPGGMEWLVILVIGLLLFGRRLPEVGRAMGRTIVEFKKGMASIEEEVNAPRPAAAPGTVSSSATASLPSSGPAASVSPADNRVQAQDGVQH